MPSFPMSECHAGMRRTFLLGVAAVLTACSGSGADTQVAAKVNKGEISIHQVHAVLQRQPRQIANDPSEVATSRVLDVLIDQELAAQAGADIGLDKDPRVLQAVAAARRELVARAYQERIAEKVLAPSSDEIDRYYDEHPELFAQRKLYILRETGFDPAVDVGLVQSVIGRSGSIEEIEKGLRDARVRHSGRSVAHAAEDLPLAVLSRIALLGIGQSTLVSASGVSRIFTVLHTHDAPVDRQTAVGAIGAYLVNERKAAAVAMAMKQLRDEARIEYVGAFVKGAAAGASAASR